MAICSVLMLDFWFKFYRLSDATFYDHINTIYQFIKPVLDNKCLFLRNMVLLMVNPDMAGTGNKNMPFSSHFIGSEVITV